MASITSQPSIKNSFVRLATGFTVTKIDSDTWRFHWSLADALLGWSAIGLGMICGRYF